MSRRSGPDRRRGPPRRDERDERARLLRLAGAVADGAPLPQADMADDRVDGALQVIAGLAERLSSAAHAPIGGPPGAVLFQWGHLDVLERIGAGASSEVYRAYDPLLALEVALKLSHPDLGWAGTGGWIAEGRRLARLRHPNIVTVHGVDSHDGRAGLWLELVRGETLDVWIGRVGALPARELCLAGMELCRGLVAIHDAGLLHCDLKPQNVLRGHDGRILITDFGAAASARTSGGGAFQRGTPLAMAPELLAGAEPDVRSDLYGLGVVLHLLATGRMPVLADSLDALVAAHGRFDPAALRAGLPAGCPPALGRLLVRLLAPAPELRPGGAGEVNALLAQMLAPATARSSEPRPSPKPALPTLGGIFGREAELAYLQQEFERAAAGQALPVLVVGESGHGKTALLASLADWLAGRGSRLLRLVPASGADGMCLPEVVDRALARIDGGRPRRGSHRHDPADVVAALSGLAPLVLGLDDLQRLDDGDRAWLRRLAGAVRGTRILLVGVLRTASGRPGELPDLFGDLPVAVLRLSALSAEESAGMVAGMLGVGGEGDLPAGLATALHQLSGGTPFYLGELVRHLVAGGDLVCDEQRGWLWRSLPEALPPSLELTLLQRCRALPDECQSALEAAAVLAAPFDPDGLAQVAAIPAARVARILAPACAAGLLEPLADGRFAFRHGLTRRAVQGTIPAARQAELHRRCAARLAGAQDAASLAALSAHAEQAGEPQRAFDAGLAALPVITVEDAPVDLAAWERLHRLLQSGAAASPARRWRVLLGRLRGLRLQGRLHEALALAEHAQTGDALRLASAHRASLALERAHALFGLGRYRCALAGLAPLLAPAGTVPRLSQACARAARLLAVRAQAALGDYRQAEATLAAALSGDPGSARERLPLLTMHGWSVALQGRLEAADADLQAALAMAGGAPAPIRADVLRRLHWVRLGRGQYQSAHALALAAHQLYRESGDAIGQAKIRLALAQVRLAQGLTEEAMGYLNRAGPELEDIGDRHCEAETRWLIAQAEIRLGGLDHADSQLVQALALIERIGDRDDAFRFLTERARLRLAQGRPAEAAEAADEARAIAIELASRDGQALCEVELAAARLAQGQPGVAVALAEAAAQALQALGSGERWRADWVLGRALLGLDRPRAALAAMASAQAAVDRIVDEFAGRERARRARLRHAWQALVDDHAGILAAAGCAAQGEALLRRWAALGAEPVQATGPPRGPAGPGG